MRRIGPQGSVESALWQKPISFLLWASIHHRMQSFKKAIKEQEEVLSLKLGSYLYSESVDY